MSRFGGRGHYQPGRWIPPTEREIEFHHGVGRPIPWLRVFDDGVDVTTRPVSEWREYDRTAYADGWRPDRFGDPRPWPDEGVGD